jgi:hypothetical protein
VRASAPCPRPNGRQAAGHYETLLDVAEASQCPDGATVERLRRTGTGPSGQHLIPDRPITVGGGER